MVSKISINIGYKKKKQEQISEQIERKRKSSIIREGAQNVYVQELQVGNTQQEQHYSPTGRVEIAMASQLGLLYCNAVSAGFSRLVVPGRNFSAGNQKSVTKKNTYNKDDIAITSQ